MLGKVICFEGIDGTGKTTQALKFKKYFEEMNYPVVYAKMGEGYLAEKILEINSGKIKVPFSTRSLLYAVNADYTDKMVVQPAVSEGKIVLLDRQYLTLIIYGTIRNKDQEWLEIINSKLTKPDLTFILLTEPEEVIKHRDKKIGIFETVRNNIKEADDLTKNYLALQNEVSDFYKKFLNSDNIFGVTTNSGIEGTFEKIAAILHSKLDLLSKGDY
jgi:dTMP kinase